MIGGGKLCSCGTLNDLKFVCRADPSDYHRVTGSWETVCSDHPTILFDKIHHTDGTIHKFTK